MATPYTILSPNSIQFHLEDLSPPEELLEEQTLKKIAQQLCPKLEAVREGEQPLVNGGYHAFMYGLYKAYSQHRPFTLSPDMLWLLVVQGFSTFVNANAATQPKLFPQLKGRKALVIINNRIVIGDPNSPWEETTHQLTQAVEEELGDDFVRLLRADFSTTGLAERVASEITILDAMKPYFEYIVVRIICGIPSITLEGTVEDWDKMLQKLEGLKQHHLAWWMEELIPIVKKIKQSAAGEIDKGFWMQIFKVHTHDDYGQPKTIDGWITRFFPFNRKGERWKLWEYKALTIEEVLKELPAQIVQVPFKHLVKSATGTVLRAYDMEYWAGFVGLEQEAATFDLRPKIHWWVAHANKKIQLAGKDERRHASGKYFYNLEEIPEEVYRVRKWRFLGLHFRENIVFPWKFFLVRTGILELSGHLSPLQKQKLKLLLKGKQCCVVHNGAQIHPKVEQPEDW